MGGGAKEKEERLLESSKRNYESAARIFIGLLSCVLTLYLLQLVWELNRVASPLEDQKIVIELANLRKRELETRSSLAAALNAQTPPDATNDGEGEEGGDGATSSSSSSSASTDAGGDNPNKYLDEKPAWVTKRNPKKKKQGEKDDDSAGSWSEEHAEIELRIKMTEWIRERQAEKELERKAARMGKDAFLLGAEANGADLVGDSQEGNDAEEEPLSEELERLRKRQQFVEDNFEAVMRGDDWRELESQIAALHEYSTSSQQRNSHDQQRRHQRDDVQESQTQHSMSRNRMDASGSSSSSSSMMTTAATGDSSSDSGRAGGGSRGGGNGRRGQLDDEFHLDTLFVSTPQASATFKTLRGTNSFSLIAPSSPASVGKLYEAHLARLGYTLNKDASSSPSSSFWLIGYGNKCPADTDLVRNDRHVVVCPYYIPSAGVGNRQIPAHSLSRSPKAVMGELLKARESQFADPAARHDAAALAEALADVYDVAQFSRKYYRLTSDKDRAKLDQALAREADRRPLFVAIQGDGAASSPQLTDNAAGLLAGHKKYASKQLVLRRYTDTRLWRGYKFVMRVHAVVLGTRPLAVLYLDGLALVSNAPYANPHIPGSPPVEDAPGSVHFPGASQKNARPVRLEDLMGSGGLGEPVFLDQEQLNWARKRMKQITAFSLMASLPAYGWGGGGGGGGSGVGSGASSTGGGMSNTPPGGSAASRTLFVQHICFDFEMDQERQIWLEAARTDCALTTPTERVALVEGVDLVAEELAVRRGETSAETPQLIEKLACWSHVAERTGLQVLVDEAKERAERRSVFDALERFVAPPAAAAAATAGRK